jgi:hypothetical protein
VIRDRVFRAILFVSAIGSEFGAVIGVMVQIRI